MFIWRRRNLARDEEVILRISGSCIQVPRIDDGVKIYRLVSYGNVQVRLRALSVRTFDEVNFITSNCVARDTQDVMLSKFCILTQGGCLGLVNVSENHRCDTFNNSAWWG